MIQREHGPTVIPYIPWGGGEGGFPNSPASYARYHEIDLDANNRYSIEERKRRFPGHYFRPLGWGVCRNGFGRLSEFDGLSEAKARTAAKMLNESTPIGVVEDRVERLERVARVKEAIGR